METCSPPAVDRDRASSFYGEAMDRLAGAGVPFLIGGAFALARYSKIDRRTKDLDLFVRPSDLSRTLQLFERAGHRTDVPFSHWLGKVHDGDHFIDIIFGSGNGVAIVDEGWFAHAIDDTVLGRTVRLCPPEEMIWSKAFIQERERFDGADIVHLVSEMGPTLDWARLLHRFGENWPVLFGHLVVFRFVYPDRRDRIPDWVIRELVRRFGSQQPETDHTCRGTLLSREQYLFDLNRLGYRDAREAPAGGMTRDQIAVWTAAIGKP